MTRVRAEEGRAALPHALIQNFSVLPPATYSWQLAGLGARLWYPLMCVDHSRAVIVLRSIKKSQLPIHLSPPHTRAIHIDKYRKEKSMTRPRVSLNYCSRHRLVHPRARQTVHCTPLLCNTTTQKWNTTTTSYKRQHQPLQIYVCNVSTEITLRNHPTDSIKTQTHHHVGNPFPMPSPPSPIGYTRSLNLQSRSRLKG